jgi:hypothetical protein
MAFVVYMMIIPSSLASCLFKRNHKIINQNKVELMKLALEHSANKQPDTGIQLRSEHNRKEQDFMLISS